MICFSMEDKHGHFLDTTVHMQDTRVAARGNATSFLMPWQSILSELRSLENKHETLRSSRSAFIRRRSEARRASAFEMQRFSAEEDSS